MNTNRAGGPGGSRAGRRGLWGLAIPALLYCAAPIVANRIEPRILGVPFLAAYVILVTIVSPIVIWFVARRDPLFRADAPEPIPADDAAAAAGTAAAGTAAAGTAAAGTAAAGTDDGTNGGGS